MIKSCRLLALGLVTLIGFCLGGCSGNPDKTGAGAGGLGPAGTNATNVPQTQQEQFEQQKKEDAEFQKRYRSGK